MRVETSHSPVDQAKEKIVNFSFVAFYFFSVPLILISVLRTSFTGWRWLYTIHLSILAICAILIMLRKKITRNQKSIILALLMFIMAGLGLISYGLLASSGMFFFGAVGFLAIYYPARYAYISIGLIVAFFVVLFSLFANHVLTYPPRLEDYLINPLVWINFCAVLVYTIWYCIYIIRQLDKAHHDFLVKTMESEERFRNMFDNSPIGNSMTAIDGTLYANKSFCELLGFTSQELSSKNWMEITHPDDIQKGTDAANELLNNRSYIVNFEKRYIHKNGSLVWVDLTIFLQRDKNGDPQYFITSIKDITERKNVMQALIENKEKFAKTFNNAPVLISITDLETGTYLDVNEEAVRVTGFSRDEIIGQTGIGIGWINEDKRTRIINELKKNERVINMEMEFKAKDGRTIVGILNGEKLDIGDRTCLLTITVDITTRKKAEEALLKAKEKIEESDRLKTAFLHNISHEIRTPMNAIIGFSQFLKNPDLKPEKRNQFLEIITQSGNQLLAIITDIVNIATIEAGQEKVQIEEVNVNSILKLLYNQFIIKAQKQNILLTNIPALTDNEAYIWTDETKITEVISNLITNALKFTNQGYIQFGYIVKADFLEFFVEDTGIGIAPEMHNEIFKRFRQLEISAHRQYGGSGLGLSISKAYVELLGGKIWLESEVGKGTTFRFAIPYKKGNSKGFPEKEPGSVRLESGKAKTILIAEDEDNNFAMLVEYLSGLKINILRAINGNEAVKLCKENPQIDLVLMDIKMPGIDGFEATRQIKSFRPELIIIAQTAYITEPDRIKAISSGCSDYLIKPIDQQLLINKIIERFAL